MSEIHFHDEFAAPVDDEDPLGPFGTGPAIDDSDPLYDPIYEQFGDYDLFGPFASREADYFDPPDPEEG